MTHSTAVAGGTLQAQFACFLEALDPDIMGPMLADVLGEDAGEDADGRCGVVDAKYEPGRPATVLYRFGSRLVHATVPPPGQDAPGALLANGVGVTVFPVDPGLPTLPAVLDAASFGPALLRALGMHGAGQPRIELLRYRPGRRATFLVTVDGDGAPEMRLVAKVYHDGAKAAAVATEGRALEALSLPHPLVLAPVVAHLPELAVVVQGHLPGVELGLDLEAQGAATRCGADVARAAHALAALHEGVVAEGRPRPIDRELHRFVDRATAVRSVDRPAGEDLLSLAHELLEQRAETGRVSLVHGDCKPSQFLLSDDRVAVIDLDHCGIADPAHDVGNFVASLHQGAIRETAGADGAGRCAANGPAVAAKALGEIFVAAYLDRAEPEGPAEFARRVDFYVAVCLMRKALRAYARAPASDLPGHYVKEARRVVADRGGGHHGRS